jgi:6-pyruvoyltetrahydropterin/6-carboxytetrahydropterin synthase
VGHRVEIEKESLIFSAAHFITFADRQGKVNCETLHGHNYRVAARIEGPVDEHALVIDFIWLRDTLRSITAQMDHRVLLPRYHPSIEVKKSGDAVTAVFENRKWQFPAGDVVILPIDNTTAERLAEFIGGRLVSAMEEAGFVTSEYPRIEIGVDENEGQWGWWGSGL